MEMLKNLNWRYATKIFDETKKISDTDMQLLKETISLAPSSYGLQLYKVLIIEDKKIREKLKPVSWGQGQITDASAIVVFCNYTQYDESQVDDYLKLKAETQNLSLEDLKGYGDFMKSKISELNESNYYTWTKSQTYIALGVLMNACAELKIDSCPMEGFETAEYDKILGLTEKGLSATVIATIGYRAESDDLQHAPKVRKSENELFEVI